MLKQSTFAALIACAALSASVALADETTTQSSGVSGTDSSNTAGSTMSDSGGATSGSTASNSATQQMHQSMTKMMKDVESMPMKNDADKDFAAMMIRHHQAGIEMAQTQLEHGKDPEIKKMAKKTIREQKKEISKLERWQKKNSQQAGMEDSQSAQ